MRYFYRLFYKLAKKEQEKLNQPHNMRYLYYYNAKARLGEPIKISILLLISITTCSFFETLLAILAFGSIRMNSGGFHAKSSNICIIYSVLLLNTDGLIARYLKLNLTILIAICGITITLIMAKSLRGNIGLKKTMIIIAINICIAIIFIIFCNKNLGEAILLGALSEAFTMTKIGNLSMRYIEGKITYLNHYRKI